MAVGISVSGSSILGFQITITDALEGDRIVVARIDNDNYYATVSVREADMISPSSSTSVYFDYEAPFNTDLTYRVRSFALSNLVTPLHTATATGLDTAAPRGFVMISRVNDSTERVTGTVDKDGMKDWSRKAKILSESDVLDRSNSVVISDVLGGRDGSWRIWNVLSHTTNFDGNGVRVAFKTEVGKWRSVLMDGSPLLFRSDVNYTGFDDCYFKVRNFSSARLDSFGWNYPDYPAILHTIDFKEVDRPLTTISGLGFDDWQDVYDTYTDWADVNSTHADWLSVLTDPTL